MTDLPRWFIAVDPGTASSAFAEVRVEPDGSIGFRSGAKAPNRDILCTIAAPTCPRTTLVIEMLGHYGTGMSVGKEVFSTALWIGRFIEAWKSGEGSIDLVLRKTYAAHLCGDARAKDGNIRQAVIDRFGGDSKAIGYQKCEGCDGKGGMGRGSFRKPCASCGGEKRFPKGPLYDVTADVWQALGLAVAYTEGVKVIPREEWAGAAHG